MAHLAITPDWYFRKDETASMPSSPKTSTSLLSLPPEVRIRIFRYALTTDSERPYIVRGEKGRSKPSVLSLLLTCSQIYHEAVLFFYEVNNLCFCNTYALFTFLDTLASNRRKHIAALTLVGYGGHWSSSSLASRAFELLQTCDRLTSFTLELDHAIAHLKVASHGHTGPVTEYGDWALGLLKLDSLRGLHHASIKVPVEVIVDDDLECNRYILVEVGAKKELTPDFSTHPQDQELEKRLISCKRRWLREPYLGTEERYGGQRRLARWYRAHSESGRQTKRKFSSIENAGFFTGRESSIESTSSELGFPGFPTNPVDIASDTDTDSLTRSSAPSPELSSSPASALGDTQPNKDNRCNGQRKAETISDTSSELSHAQEERDELYHCLPKPGLSQFQALAQTIDSEKEIEEVFDNCWRRMQEEELLPPRRAEREMPVIVDLTEP
ncbi:hypothetical protein MMC25_007000 [Agyrium rufum]|nr:hypothetical protein [Agyrium rufum]